MFSLSSSSPAEPADPAVVGGAILLVALSLFGYDFDTQGRRQPDRASEPEGTTSPAASDPATSDPAETEADVERDG